MAIFWAINSPRPGEGGRRFGRLAAGLLLALLLAGGCGDDAPVHKAPPFKLAAQYTAGPSQGPDALAVWLTARRPAGPKGRDVAEPIRLEADRTAWQEGVSLLLANQRKLSKGIKLASAPKEKELISAPGRAYLAIYRLAPGARPEPGKSFRVLLTLGDFHFTSPLLRAPQPAASQGEELRRQARTALRLGDAETALSAGKALIEQEPQSLTGYWYQGRGLEAKRDYAGALASYRQALKRFSDLPPKPGREPPAALINALRRVSARLRAAGKAPQPAK